MNGQLDFLADGDQLVLLDLDGNQVVVPIEGLVVRPGPATHRYLNPRSVLEQAPRGPGTPRHQPPYKTSGKP